MAASALIISKLRSKIFRLMLAAAFVVLAGSAVDAPGCQARPSGDHFEGVEFFGSSQMTRMELTKLLGLKSGAPVNSVERAIKRAAEQLERQHIRANFQMVSVSPDRVYVVVDIMDSREESLPTRRLKQPRHVILSTERPLELLVELHDRLDKLQAEGRMASESFPDGIKHFSDEPAEQIAAEIFKYLPNMRGEFLAVVDSDPDPTRRLAAVELLNFAGSVPDTAARLVPALDDSDAQVRIAVDRYIFPRLKLLNDEFPYTGLIDGLSRQLRRPTHEDRTKSLYTMLALSRVKPLLLRQIKEQDEQKIKELADQSVLPTVKDPCQSLISAIAEWDKGPLPR